MLSHVLPVMAPALALAADPDAALVRLERIAEAVGERSRPPTRWRPIRRGPTARAPRGCELVRDRRAGRGARSILALSGTFRHAGRRRPGRAGEAVPPPPGAAPAAGTGAASPRWPIALSGGPDGVAPGLPFAVIGMGKLGAREQSFASDLDLVFVYEGEGAQDLGARRRRRGPDAPTSARRAGRPTPIFAPRDARSARPLDGRLPEYWERYADPWEFQSLLRAREVAGDPGLGRRFERRRGLGVPAGRNHAGSLRDPPHARADRARAGEAARGGEFHFKLGLGSLADVQFTVELCSSASAARTRREVAAYARRDRAPRRGAAARYQVARDLGEAFVFLSDVKDALEVDRRVHAEMLPASPGGRPRSRGAWASGVPATGFLERYLRVTRRCRRAMERVFPQALA